MHLHLTLQGISEPGTWSVSKLSVYNEINRVPLAFVECDCETPPQLGAELTLVVAYGAGQVASITATNRTHWYVDNVRYTSYTSGVNHCWMSLLPDPVARQQVAPFAVNRQNAQEVISQRLTETAVTFQGPQELPTLQTLISQGETLEQLSRRLALDTNHAFRIFPQDAQWTLKWNENIRALSPGPESIVTNGVRLSSELQTSLEPGCQQLRLPGGYHEALREPAATKQLFHVQRPLHTGTSGEFSLQHGPAQTETLDELTAMHSQWFELTEIDTLMTLWQGCPVRDEANPLAEAATPIASLFLYDGQGAQDTASQSGGASELSGTQAALRRYKRHAGTARDDDTPQSTGWLCIALGVPRTHLPQEKALLEHILHSSQVRPLCEQLIQDMGGVQQNLRPPAPMHWGTLPAIVSNNPNNVHLGSVTRSEDLQRYLTRIWVRVLGTDTDVEVDWAIPFASHDNSGDGASSGGALTLVPENNTLGYLAFMGGNGAPFFYANTHYPNCMVSDRINPADYKHGLVTDGGLRVQETSRNIVIHAFVRVTLVAYRMLQNVGKKRTHSRPDTF